MSIEEVLFGYILTDLIINEKKTHKKLAKQLLKKKLVEKNKHYGKARYQYKDGTTHLSVVFKDSATFNQHITHPVAPKKKKEIQACMYDLAWLNAQALKYLNLRNETRRA